MKTTSKTQKRIALAAGLLVTLLAVFASEFTSHGETIHNEAVLEIDEAALIERAIVEMEEGYYIPQEAITKTIKVFDKENELMDIIHLNEGELVEDVFSERLLNQAEFLSEYGNTMIYKLQD